MAARTKAITVAHSTACATTVQHGSTLICWIKTVLHRVAPWWALVFVLGAAAAAGQQHQRPARIISLIPAITEMLYALGAGPQVVGVSSFDRYPPEVSKVERVGALLDPNLERILALRPDLVAVYGSQTDLREQLARANIGVFVYTHGGLASVSETIRRLGAAVGRSAEASALARRLEQRVDEIRRTVAGRPRPKTVVVFGREAGALRGIYASGGTGFIHEMVDAAGAENVFADVQREAAQVTTELILPRRPDVVLELRASLTRSEAAKETRVWSALSALPAVKTGRVYVLIDERTVVPGPRVAEGVELLARTLHPDVFR